MAPRRTRGPRPRPTWGGRRREGAPRCSSGGSPSPAAAVAGAAGAAVAPSSWKSQREPSSQLPVGHASSAVVAKVAAGHSSASSSSGHFLPRDEVSTSSLRPPCMSSPSGCSPQQPGLAACVADADGAVAVVGVSSGDPSAALLSSLPEEGEPLPPALQMEVALLEEEEEEDERLWFALQEEVALQKVVAKFVVFYLDAHKKKTISTDEIKSLSPALRLEVAIDVLFQFDLARKKRILSANELDLIIHLKNQLPSLEEEVEEEERLLSAIQKEAALQMVVAKFMVFYFDAHEKRTISTDEVKSLSPALKMEVAIEVLFQFDLARKKRILSADELDLIIHLKSQLASLEAEIGEVNAHGAEEEEEEEEEELLVGAARGGEMQVVHLEPDLTVHSRSEVPLWDFDPMLVELEACLTKSPEEEEHRCSEVPLRNFDPMLVEVEACLTKRPEEDEEDEDEEGEEDEEAAPLSPSRKMEAALKIMFRLDLAREMRTLSADELDLYDDMKSLLPRLEAEIGEDNADGADVVEEEDNADGADAVEEEEEPLSPSLVMEAALKIMFRLDLAREMRTLSADELDLYDFMKSLFSCLEVKIREVATAPSIALEDPPTCQLHVPSVALAGVTKVPLPMVPDGYSTKLSTDLQLAERSIIATNAELSTPGPEGTPSALKSSAEPEPAVVDVETTEALYGYSVHRLRLPIFRDICPE